MDTAYLSPLTRDTRLSAPFAQRCKEMGITLVTTDAQGRVLSTVPRNSGAIDAELAESVIFATHLHRASRHWSGSEHPEPSSLWPGCWVVPIPIQRRRQRTGYHVAVLVTREIVQSQQLDDLCTGSGIDRLSAVARVEACAPASVDFQGWASMLRWMHQDLATIDRQGNEIDDLTRQLGEAYEELSLVYKLSARMSVTHDPLSFLTEALSELQEVIGLGWAALRLAEDEPRLHELRGRMIIAGHCPYPDGELGTWASGLVSQSDPINSALCRPPVALGRGEGDSQVLVVPVRRDDRLLAIFIGGDKEDGQALSSIDSKLATAAVQNMAIFLENAMLYDDMEDIFMGTLHALVASIDAKDSYTFGHSERVAWLSREIARAAGLGEQAIERVYLSALVHDVGKIGVPESVLTKPGRLTPAEFEMVKAHPELGVRILERIPQMRDLIPGVLHHHERYDGGGYPYGLASGDIPLFGRIICLADSFDAMSSSRTYRNAMPVEEVFNEITRCAGAHFDPDLAQAFMKRVDLSRYYAMLADHQDHRSPLRQVMRMSA